MRYRVAIEAAALKTLAELPPRLQARVESHIEALGDEPRPADARFLTGGLRGLYRLRVGDYRIVYEVDDEASMVRVALIGHRGHVYKRQNR